MSKYQSWKNFLLSTRNFAVGFIRTSWRTLHVHQSSAVTQPWEGCFTSDITTQESCCNYRRKPVAQKCLPAGSSNKWLQACWSWYFLQLRKQNKSTSFLMFTGNHTLKMQKGCVDRHLNSILAESFPAR